MRIREAGICERFIEVSIRDIKFLLDPGTNLSIYRAGPRRAYYGGSSRWGGSRAPEVISVLRACTQIIDE